MYLPNNGLAVPFCRQLDGPMHPGRVVAVFGSIPHGCDRFVVNFQCGEHGQPDIALHLSFRFHPEPVIVRNSFQGDWQFEETEGGSHLRPGQHFQLLVLCEPHAWKIAINGHHFTEFHHRVPFDHVSHIAVEGSVEINNVTGVVSNHDHHCHRTFNPSVPHIQFIEPVFPGRLIRVQGRAPFDGSRFTFNLACGPTLEHDDIVLHMSVRINDGCVVLNTFAGGHWQVEQTISPCPVRAGHHFELILLADHHHFKIAFNGIHLAEFQHRISMDRANHVIIDGGVELQLVSYEGEHRHGGLDFHPPPPPQDMPFFANPYPESDQKYQFFPNPYPIYH